MSLEAKKQQATTASAVIHQIDAAVKGELNDAYVLNEEPEGFAEFLNKPATLLIGEMWGAKDRRNTQDGDWKAVTMPWGQWIEGGAATTGKPAWGFSRHPAGKRKEGACIVLGSSVEGARKANAMDEMFALGLDIDSGSKLDDVVTKIRELNLFALIYTSHSHGKSGLEIKRDEVMRKLGIDKDPTLPEIQEFLRTHSKSRYEESFIAQVRIDDLKKQTKEGVKIALTTPPLDKFRIIFPLAEAVKLIDLAPTQAAALEVWEDKITGMAWEALGVHFDTSCTDPSRLFYTARHAAENEWDCMIIRGLPLDFADAPVYKKHLYTKHRDKLSPFEIAGDDAEKGVAPPAFTPAGQSLNDWHHHAKDRFQIATLLQDMVPEKIRVAGGEAEGHVHIECPFEAHHTSEGGTATMAIDALDSQSDYWTVFCRHDACQGRHKLQFLEEMLAQNWFEEDVLFDEDGLYILPPGEEVSQDAASAADAVTLDITAPLGSTLKAAVQSLNARFAAVNLGGGLRFIRRPDHSIQGEDNMEVWTKNSLKEFYEDQKVKGADDKYVNPVDRFAATAKRHSRADFAPPGYDVPATTYNLFSGFSMTPVQGDCTVLKDFIRDVVCDGDEEAFKWLWLWMAHMIQRPGEKPGTAVVVHGAGGAGKGTFGELLHKLVHPYSMTAQHKEHVVGKFAGVALTFSILCHAEEALFAGNPEIADTLKTKVTKEWEQVEPKGQQSFTAHSCTRYYIDSNHKAAVNIEGNGSERRFFVLQVSDARRGDLEYFEKVYAALEGPEMAALVYELMQYDPASAGMKWRDVRIAPETRARQLMGYQSRSVVERSLLDVFNEGGFKIATEGVEYTFNLEAPTRVGSTHLKEFLKRDGSRYHADDRDPMALMDAMFGNAVSVGRAKGTFAFALHGEMEKKNTHFFEFPPLRELYQAMFEKGYRVSPDPDEEVRDPEVPGAAYGPRGK